VDTFISNNTGETEGLGRKLAKNLEKGAVVALTGDLGSGKTAFAKGIAAGLAAAAHVTSPTFSLIHEYRGGRLPMYHFDFFRLEDRESVERLDLDDYFSGDGVCVVEWADKFPDLLPGNAIWVRFETKSPNERLITVQ
jgi:tRNA threonylcarbamoyladenosine biosynthesis protein TsaE